MGTGSYGEIPPTMLGLEGSCALEPYVSLLKSLKVGTWSRLETCFLPTVCKIVFVHP